jgi:Tfp pilus assembly protein PilN
MRSGSVVKEMRGNLLGSGCRAYSKNSQLARRVIIKAVINQLNLSSRPFRNRTLPWLLAAAVAGVSVFGFLFVFSELRSVNAKREAVADSVKKIEPQTKELKQQGEEIKGSFTPEQRNSLLAAHALIARKRFSWSRLFADLENVLPRNVIVSNISVRDIYQSGDRTSAELEFAVVSKDYQSVLTMINEMQNSGIFQAELRGQDLQSGKGGLTEYSLNLIYTPRYGAVLQAEETGVSTAQNQSGTGEAQ